MSPIKFKLRLLLLISVFPIFVYAQSKNIVNCNNFANYGWVEEQINQFGTGTLRSFATAYVDIKCGPEQASEMRPGSVFMTLPSSNEPSLRRVRLRNAKYDGVYLNTLAAYASFPGCLRFDTYVVNNKNGSNIDLVLQIDTDNDNDIDYNLAFNPVYQHQHSSTHGGTVFPVVENFTWQTWNAAAGWWVVGLDQTLPNGMDTFRLFEFCTLFPESRIKNTTTGNHSGGGIRFTLGTENADQIDFVGYLDAFMIFKRPNRISRESGIQNERPNTALLYDFHKIGKPPCNLVFEFVRS